MTGSQALSISGTALMLAGGLVLSYRDLRPSERTYADLRYGFRRREAWIGVPLLATGSVLLILGIVFL